MDLMRAHPWLVVAAALLGILGTGCSAGDDDEQRPEGATETNVAPAPCDSDADCPTRCVFLELEDGGKASGFCEEARP